MTHIIYKLIQFNKSIELYVSDDRKQLIDDIERFVINTCGTRPKSHNHMHMFKVRDNSKMLLSLICILYFISLLCVMLLLYALCVPVYIIVFLQILILSIYYANINALTLLIELVALLHDVADHKYIIDDCEIISKMYSFLYKLTQDQKTKSIVKYTLFSYLFNPTMITLIIDRISFSKQQKYGSDNWINVLGIFGVFVRNIVSDADKLEAIGKKGIKRCRHYTIETFEKNSIHFTEEDVLLRIKQHYHEKLKLLSSSEYMKTIPGRLLGKLLDYEMNSISSLKL